MNVAIVLLFAITISMSFGSLAHAQSSTDPVDSTPTPANLPPLILQSPDDKSITQEENYIYKLEASKFIIIDDGDVAPTLTCEVNGDNSTSQILDSNVYNHEHKVYGIVFELDDGTHTINCVADDGPNQTSVQHTIDVTVITSLFPNPDHEIKIKRIAKLYPNVISHDTLGKVFKYFHTAGILDFDIKRDSGHPSTNSINQHEISNWAGPYWNDQIRKGNNVAFKQHLEQVANSGFFDTINLGFN